jgi:hypothetical protein
MNEGHTGIQMTHTGQRMRQHEALTMMMVTQGAEFTQHNKVRLQATKDFTHTTNSHTEGI